MKIVQIVTQMEAGGAQRVALLLHEALQSRGHEVELWFLYLKRPSHKHIPGVKVLLDRKPSMFDYIKIVAKLWQWMSCHKPDILITHTYYANVLGQLLASLLTVPTRIAVQQNPLYSYPKLARWADFILGAIGCYSFNVAVSTAVVDSATKYPKPYKSKLTRIYNGSTFPEIEVSPQEIRRRWGLPENAPLLINVGRLARQKNQSTLIESLLHIPQAHLLLVGEGELRAALHRQVTELQLEQRVHFLGELPSQDVCKLLRSADVFVFPSLFEGTPMALVEAMGSGLPVVASDIPPIQEVLNDAGILVSSDNAEAIANAVQQILGSSELVKLMRDRSINRASLFSLQKMVNDYESLFV